MASIDLRMYRGSVVEANILMDQAVIIQKQQDSTDLVYGTVQLNENVIMPYIGVGNRMVVETSRGMRMIESKQPLTKILWINHDFFDNNLSDKGMLVALCENSFLVVKGQNLIEYPIPCKGCDAVVITESSSNMPTIVTTTNTIYERQPIYLQTIGLPEWRRTANFTLCLTGMISPLQKLTYSINIPRNQNTTLRP